MWTVAQELSATYRYADRRTLDRAVAQARAELGERVPVRWAVRDDATLIVDVAILGAAPARLARAAGDAPRGRDPASASPPPAAAQEPREAWRRVANALLILAHLAIEGMVERGPRPAGAGAVA
jgi:hypothetical protein